MLDQKDEIAINGYESILEPKIMKPDICYHLNQFLENSKYIAINAAVEESTLKSKQNKLSEHDLFISENITPNDTLVISIGCNDIALNPDLTTVSKLFYLMDFTASGNAKNNTINYFIDLFKNGITEYIRKLTIKNKPEKIIICMIYYPDLTLTKSWCGNILKSLDYHKFPNILQTIIEQIYNLAISKIQIEDLKIIAFPMFKFLDGSDTKDYVQMVEPSNIGGKKIAEELVKIILE